MKPFSGVRENVRVDWRCQDLRCARALDLTAPRFACWLTGDSRSFALDDSGSALS